MAVALGYLQLPIRYSQADGLVAELPFAFPEAPNKSKKARTVKDHYRLPFIRHKHLPVSIKRMVGIGEEMIALNGDRIVHLENRRNR